MRFGLIEMKIQRIFNDVKYSENGTNEAERVNLHIPIFWRLMQTMFNRGHMIIDGKIDAA